MSKRLKLEGKVKCHVCGNVYDWKETDDELKVYVTDPGHLVNGVHEDVYVDVYSRCDECCYYNKHQGVKIKVINE